VLDPRIQKHITTLYAFAISASQPYIPNFPVERISGAKLQRTVGLLYSPIGIHWIIKTTNSGTQSCLKKKPDRKTARVALLKLYSRTQLDNLGTR